VEVSGQGVMPLRRDIAVDREAFDA
jgi:hypothetical protein